MRLINARTYEFVEFLDERALPPYAILSHTWGAKEVQFHHMLKHKDVRSDQTADFTKIDFTCEQAQRDSLDYAWVDTCCIDKSSSAELTEAINSMYRWYQKSTICYVYMSDCQVSTAMESLHESSDSNVNLVLGKDKKHERMTRRKSEGNPSAMSVQVEDALADRERFEAQNDHGTPRADLKSVAIQECQSQQSTLLVGQGFQWYASGDVHAQNEIPAAPQREVGLGAPVPFEDSRWFTRGWTLQELLAPQLLAFYDRNACYLGTQHDLLSQISTATGIPSEVLDHSRALDSYSIARRMSWASKRRTTRLEDEAYCLLGVFSVNMPLLYGEGKRAFWRLQEEIMKQSSDQSILAYKGDRGDILAPSPACFAHSTTLAPTESSGPDKSFEITNRGLRIQLRVWSGWVGDVPRTFLLLDCLDSNFPGHYIALEAENQGAPSAHLSPRDQVGLWELRLKPDGLLQRIPYLHLPGPADYAWPNFYTDSPALAKRRAVVMLRTPDKSVEVETGIGVQLHFHASVWKLSYHVYPEVAWRQQAFSTDLSKSDTYGCTVSLTDRSGTSYMLLVRRHDRPWRNDYTRPDTENCFHYRLAIFDTRLNDGELDVFLRDSYHRGFDAYVHKVDEKESLHLRMSRQKRLTIDIEPSPANEKISIITFRIEPTKYWWLSGAPRRRVKQACFWASLPVWYPLLMIKEIHHNWNIRSTWRHPIAEDHIVRLMAWTER